MLWSVCGVAALATLVAAPQLWAEPPLAASPAPSSSAPSSSAQSAGAAPRVARLVHELGADSFAVRTLASEELAKLGAAARAEIVAATRSDDPEVRLRAKDLLRAINVSDLWSPARFTCPQGPTAAAVILKQLSEQTGNHVLIGDQFGTFTDAVVHFDTPRPITGRCSTRSAGKPAIIAGPITTAAGRASLSCLARRVGSQWRTPGRYAVGSPAPAVLSPKKSATRTSARRRRIRSS